MIEFKLTGNWSIAGDALRGLPREVQSAGVWGQRKAAELIVKTAKAHINNQDLGWAPRSESTTSGDSRILVDTEAYYYSITSWKKGNTYFAGVPLGATNGKGVPIILYANIHEFGFRSRGIPARPLWRPTYKEVGGKKGIQKIVSAAIMAKMLKLKLKGFEVT